MRSGPDMRLLLHVGGINQPPFDADTGVIERPVRSAEFLCHLSSESFELLECHVPIRSIDCGDPRRRCVQPTSEKQPKLAIWRWAPTAMRDRLCPTLSSRLVRRYCRALDWTDFDRQACDTAVLSSSTPSSRRRKVSNHVLLAHCQQRPALGMRFRDRHTG